MPNTRTAWIESADPQKLQIARRILDGYKHNDHDVQQKAADSPEPYRTIMYTLWSDAYDLDGSSDYWQVVRYFEALLNDREPEYDWND